MSGIKDEQLQWLKESFSKLVLSLPCVQYFGNMAHQLLNYWRKIDDKVKSLTCDDLEITQMFGWTEDANEVLMYISDVLAVPDLDQRIKDTIMICLLNFAYLPCIINSLVVFDKGGQSTNKTAKVQWQMPKLCLNLALYFLSQTFKTFAENGVKLLKILTILLFTQQSSTGVPEYLLEKVNVDYEECRQNVFKFSMRSLKKTDTSSFLKYIQQNYNAEHNFTYFIEKHYQIDQNNNFDFLS